MSKNKDMYGVVRKSQPIPNHSTELTENLPETNRRGWITQPVKKAAQKQSIKKANFLFFFSFVSLIILAMPTTLWADLVSLRVDSGGDTTFRGELDRLRIIFTVDDSDEEDPYIVEVGEIITDPGPDEKMFVSRGVIGQGVVSADETVELFGTALLTAQNFQTGTIRFKLLLMMMICAQRQL